MNVDKENSYFLGAVIFKNDEGLKGRFFSGPYQKVLKKINFCLKGSRCSKVEEKNTISCFAWGVTPGEAEKDLDLILDRKCSEKGIDRGSVNFAHS